MYPHVDRTFLSACRRFRLGIASRRQSKRIRKRARGEVERKRKKMRKSRVHVSAER
jgi:hypothetical protein